MLSRLAAAFRLRQVVVTETAGVPQGTAKHGLTDHRDVGHERHVALIRRVVNGLFSPEYLRARGLTAEEAAQHNDRVVRALDVVLGRWDQLATVANALPELFGRIEKLLSVEMGLAIDLPIFLGAYHSRYGYLHPCLAHLTSWAKGPGLRPWWGALEVRSRTPIKTSALGGRGVLDSHTARDLRAGKALPKESTIGFLAERLSTHGIRALGEERDATASELEFELRAATAAVQYRKLVERFQVGAPDDVTIMHFRAIFGILEHSPVACAEDLLGGGMQSERWAKLRPRVDATLAAHLQRMALGAAVGAADELAQLQANPQAAMQRMAADCRERASFWRNVDQRPGADGPDKRWAEWLEGERDTWLALAEGRPQDIRADRTELLAELRSDALCLEAVAPWLNLVPEQQEERLREAVRVYDSSSYAHRRLALHLRARGRIEEAIHHLRRAIELNPDNEESRESLAMIHLESGCWSEVLAVAGADCRTATLLAARARALFSVGDSAEARTLVDGILAQTPKHPMALRVLALCHREQGEERKARELEGRANLYERGVGLSVTSAPGEDS
jgi:tetratricopeptide (TPR) repeat protein